MGKIIYGNYIIEKYKEGSIAFLISIGKFVYCDSYREAVNEIHNDCKRFSNWYSTTKKEGMQVPSASKNGVKTISKKNVMTKL